MFETTWLEKRLRHISRRLTSFDLQKSDPSETALKDADLDQYLFGRSRPTNLFLNFYSQQGLIDALDRYGTVARLRERGFDPHLTIRQLDQDRHMLRVRDGMEGAVLIELVCRYAKLKLRDTRNGLEAGALFGLIAIEWLLLQNPRADFNENKPQLPGQKYPGLGIGREIFALLEIMTNRLQQEGMLAFPEHYHNGQLYDRRFRFFSPQREGELKALERDLEEFSLSEASWAINKGKVIDILNGKPYQWRGEEMIWPLSDRLRDYFKSDQYNEETEKAFRKRHFQVDRATVERIMKRVRATRR